MALARVRTQAVAIASRLGPAPLMVAATVLLAVAGSVAILTESESAERAVDVPLDVPDGSRPVMRLIDIPPTIAPPADSLGPRTTERPARSEASRGAEGRQPPSTTISQPPQISTTMLSLSHDSGVLAASGSGLSAVVRLSSGLLAVGATGEPGAIVLASENGRDWSRLEAAERSLGAAQVRAVTTFRDRLIAVGSLDGRVAAWESSDGLEWNAVDVGFGHEGVGFLADVESYDGTVVAIGFEVRGASTWILTGKGFEPTAGVGDADGGVALAAVTSVDDGFVAGGNDTVGPVTWWSEDGVRWTKAAIERDGPTAVVRDVAGTSTALAAVGYDESGPRSWWSSDGGRTWRPADGPPTTDARPQLLTSAAHLGQLMIAVGQGNGGPLCWVTGTRSVHWETCSPEGASTTAMPAAIEALDDETAIAVGRATESHRGGIAMWLFQQANGSEERETSN